MIPICCRISTASGNWRSASAPARRSRRETETGIKADRIVRLARELAEAAPRVLWYPGWFTARYADSSVTVRSAYLCINALLGSIGARGGMPISLSPKETGKRLRPLSALYPNITKPMADKADWQQPGLLHRAFDAAVTGDPYPVRAYISMRHNILSSLPDPDTLRSKLDKLDLIVAITTTWSPTADYADIVLPLSPALSRESILASKLGLKPQFFRTPARRAAAFRHALRLGRSCAASPRASGLTSSPSHALRIYGTTSLKVRGSA